MANLVDACFDEINLLRAILAEREAELAAARAERNEMERGKWAAMGLQQGGAVIIRQLEAERDAARAATLKALDDWTRPSAIRLMAGEMTAQEMRTAQAVANGLASRVRAALTPRSEGETDGA